MGRKRIAASTDTSQTARPRDRAVSHFSKSNDARYHRLATMTPMLADGHHGTQFEAGHGGNDIEPGLTFHANRLKGE